MVPFWGRCTTHFRTYFSGYWDVHRGYDLDFDPWPYGCGSKIGTQNVTLANGNKDSNLRLFLVV